MIYLSHFIDSNTPVYGGVNNEITIDQIRSIKNGNKIIISTILKF